MKPYLCFLVLDYVEIWKTIVKRNFVSRVLSYSFSRGQEVVFQGGSSRFPGDKLSFSRGKYSFSKGRVEGRETCEQVWLKRRERDVINSNREL